jgi:hypothetical protein
MATSYKTPDVYVEEISRLPQLVAQVETAIPAFIGYTEKDMYNGSTLVNKPTRIKSLKEYEEIFGFAQATTLKMTINNIGGKNTLVGDVIVPALNFRMYYALQLYFANGGGPLLHYLCCKIHFDSTYFNTEIQAAKAGLDSIRKEGEPTILLFPDALCLDEVQFYQLYRDALKQAGELMDRVAIIDMFTATGTEPFAAKAAAFRSGIGDNFLSYGAAYYPYLRTNIVPYVNEETHEITGGTIPGAGFLRLPDTATDLTKSIYHTNTQIIFRHKKVSGKK